MYSMPYLFFKNFKNQDLSQNFSNCSNFNILLGFLVNLINGDAFVSAATADACSMVHLVCFFYENALLALLQDICRDLVRCTFLRKLSACVRNITVFWQHLLSPIISAKMADNDISVKPKYRPDISVYLYPLYQPTISQ